MQTRLPSITGDQPTRASVARYTARVQALFFPPIMLVDEDPKDYQARYAAAYAEAQRETIRTRRQRPAAQSVAIAA